MKSIRYFTIFCIVLISACHKDPVGNDPNYLQNDIYAFVFNHDHNPGLTEDVFGTISNDTIRVQLPYGTNLASLTPSIAYHGTSISPQNNTSQNFSSPVHYVVTAGNGNTVDYVVIVSIHYRQKVFVGSELGMFYAVDGDTGFFLWSYSPTITGPIVSEAAYENNTVYFCTPYEFYALDANTGLVKWVRSVFTSVAIIPIIVNNGILYFTSENGLTALNANTGAQLWNRSGPLFANPTYDNGVVYCASESGIKSFDANTGQPLLTYGTNVTRGNVAVSNDAVYTASESKTLTSYNKTTGSLNWEFDESLGFPLNGSGCSPTIHNGVVFNGGLSHYMYAVDISTGLANWKSTFTTAGLSGDENFTAPLVANGMVYTTMGIYTVALDELTGNLRWSTLTTGTPCTVCDRTVFVRATNYSVMALDAFTGLEKWRFGDHMINASACVVTEDGRIFNSGISGKHQ